MPKPQWARPSPPPAATRTRNRRHAATLPAVPAAAGDGNERLNRQRQSDVRAAKETAGVTAGDRTGRTSLRAPPRTEAGTFAAQPPGEWQAWMQPYLDALVANCGQVVAACKTAGVGRTTLAKYRHINAAFEKAEVDAMSKASETAESEAKRRAVDGVKSVEVRSWTDAKGVVHTLERRETKYSDTIMLRLLERLETGSWRQKQQIEHSGGLTFKTRAERRAALEKARAEAAAQQPVTALNGRS